MNELILARHLEQCLIHWSCTKKVFVKLIRKGDRRSQREK